MTDSSHAEALLFILENAVEKAEFGRALLGKEILRLSIGEPDPRGFDLDLLRRAQRYLRRASKDLTLIREIAQLETLGQPKA